MTERHPRGDHRSAIDADGSGRSKDPCPGPHGEGSHAPDGAWHEPPRWGTSRPVRLARTLLRWAAALVPFGLRTAWHREWEGELWALHARGRSGTKLVRFALGGVAHALWERREEEGMMTHGLMQDIRLALRRIRRAPGFALITVGVLGLGIAANTSLFGALNAVLLQEPPYPGADRLVLVDLTLQADPDQPADTMVWSYPKFEHGREALTSLGRMAGYWGSTATMTDAGSAARLQIEYVTPDYFPLLGVTPAVGRLLSSAEEAPADATVALLSYELWMSRFGADPAVVGRTITLEGSALEIVGVTREGFHGLTGSARAFVPVAAIPTIGNPRRLQMASAHWLQGIGSLRPGISLEQAREQARAAGRSVSAAYPDPDGVLQQSIALVPYLSARVNPVARTAVGTVSAAALLFLLIACGSVASLLLARASARRTDVAIRAALGAGRGRLVREQLIESTLLAGAGGLLGVALAMGGQRLVATAIRYALDTSGTRGLQYVDPDALGLGTGALALGLACALGTGLLFGIAPALVSSRAGPGGDLRLSGSLGRGRRGDAGRSALVAVQLALTVILLAGTALMSTSFARLANVDMGFTHTNVLTLAYDRGPGHTDDEQHAFVDELLVRVEALPGVERASAVTCPPLAGRCEIVGVREIDGGEPDETEATPLLTYAATDDYFETVGVPLREGRLFDRSDADGAPVVLLGESAARRLFPDGSAIGHTIAVTHSLTESEPATVVGVVGDVRYAGLDQEPMPTAYLSERQVGLPHGTLMVRTTGEPATVIESVREAVAALDASLPVDQVGTLAERFDAATARTRIILGLLASFGLSGLLIGALGLYGLVAHAVQRRTAEVGLRMALGADRAGVLRLIVRRPAAIALGAAVLGGVTAWRLTHYLDALSYGPPPPRPIVLAAAALVLFAVSAVAAWVPAHRATRIPPTRALRG